MKSFAAEGGRAFLASTTKKTVAAPQREAARQTAWNLFAAPQREAVHT